MQISVEITNVIVDPEFNAAEIIITPVFSSGEGSTGIQSVSKNGTPIVPIGGNADITVPTKTSDLTKDDVYTKSETYTQTEINNKLSAVYKYKFSVDYYSQLPLVRENGDTYNVRFNDDGTDSGANYAWSNELNDWDSLGGLIGLATLTENGLLSKEDFALLRNLYTADEIDQLLLSFAKLSGGNTFSGKQVINGNVYDMLEISSTEANGSFLLLNNSHAGGTSFGIGSGINGSHNLGIYDFKQDDFILKLYADGNFDLGGKPKLGTIALSNKNGNLSMLRDRSFYQAASHTADTINDIRTVNTAGLWELFKCSVANATKGAGTWIYGKLKLGMVIETDINEYADNAAALAAGLTSGMKYRTGDLLKIVH